jgi:multidrug resistance efflux pump
VTGPQSGSPTATKDPEDRPEEANEPVKAPGKRKMKRSSRIAFTIIAILALLAALGFGGSYFLYSRNYVTTDNAQVDGDKIDINAPTTGTLTNWTVTQGSQVKTNQVLGRIQITGSMAQPQRVIKSPGEGTVAVKNAVNGSYVTAGDELATAYDFNKIYVTARVDETDVAGVHNGALVDLSVDAFPGVAMTGMVEDVQGASAGSFSLFPQDNSSGNFQKVTQVIPVKIALVDTGGQQLVPGMNVTVHIHKN